VFGLSLPVAIAYWTVAWTADMHGFHCVPCSDRALPPRKKDRHPLLVSVCCNSRRRCWSHRLHLNKKCLTVSFALPQAHWSVSEAPIWCKYPLRRDIPVRSWASTFASSRLRLLYRSRVCFPSSAVSSSLMCLPTPFGSSCLSLSFASFPARIVLLAPCFTCPTRPASVAPVL
jgi:hypothetical protein